MAACFDGKVVSWAEEDNHNCIRAVIKTAVL
jgi:hypothetical protein